MSQAAFQGVPRAFVRRKPPAMLSSDCLLGAVITDSILRLFFSRTTNDADHNRRSTVGLSALFAPAHVMLLMQERLRRVISARRL
jgi:hypothetical protein